MSTQITITLNDRTAEQALQDIALAFDWKPEMRKVEKRTYNGALITATRPPMDILREAEIYNATDVTMSNGIISYSVEITYTADIEDYGLEVLSQAVNKQMQDAKIKADSIRASEALETAQIATVTIVTT